MFFKLSEYHFACKTISYCKVLCLFHLGMSFNCFPDSFFWMIGHVWFSLCLGRFSFHISFKFFFFSVLFVFCFFLFTFVSLSFFNISVCFLCHLLLLLTYTQFIILFLSFFYFLIAYSSVCVWYIKSSVENVCRPQLYCSWKWELCKKKTKANCLVSKINYC